MSRKRRDDSDMANIRERIVWRNGRPQKHYQVRLQVKDDQGRTRKRRETFHNLSDARKFRDVRKGQFHLGDIGDKLLTQEEMKIFPLSRFFLLYRQHLFFKRKRSSNNEWIMLRAFLEHPVGKEIAAKTLYEWRMDGIKFLNQYRNYRMGVDQVSLTTLQRELNPIRAMFEIIRSEHDFPIGDPFPEFFKRLKEKLQNDPSNQPRKPYVLRSRLEELKLYGAIEQQSNNPKLQRKWLSLIRMALITALRRGVLLQLKWGDVDWEEDLLRIPSHYCHKKKNAPEILPLTIELRALLESYRSTLSESEKQEDQRLFPNEGTYVDKVFQKIADRAELYRLKEDGSKDHMTFHDLRHTALTRYNRGEHKLSPDENSYLAGHMPRGTNVRYRFQNIEPEEWAEGIREKLNAQEDDDKIRDAEGNEIPILTPLTIAYIRQWMRDEHEKGTLREPNDNSPLGMGPMVSAETYAEDLKRAGVKLEFVDVKAIEHHKKTQEIRAIQRHKKTQEIIERVVKEERKRRKEQQQKD